MDIYEKISVSRLQDCKYDGTPVEIYNHLQNLHNSIYGYSKADSIDDKLFLARLEMRDRQRAIIYQENIPKVAKALEKQIVNTVSKDLNKMVSDIQKNI